MELIGSGACAQIYRDGDRAIKVFAERYPLEAVLQEADNMARVTAQTRLPVPRMYNVCHDKARWSLVMEYVSGAPLFDEHSFSPERLSMLITIQLSIHACRVDMKNTVHSRLKRALGRALLTEPQRVALTKRLEAMPQGYSLLHADFHPLNVLANGDSYFIIDWQNACTGAPAYDIARTSILMMGASVDMANAYINEAISRACVSAESVRAWLPLAAAERLSENQPARVNTQLLRLVNQL